MENIETVLKEKRPFVYELRKNFSLYLMLVPGLLILLVNNYLPMPGILLAFKDFNYAKGFLGSDWVGFDNGHFMMGDDQEPAEFMLSCGFLLFVTINKYRQFRNKDYGPVVTKMKYWKNRRFRSAFSAVYNLRIKFKTS